MSSSEESRRITRTLRIPNVRQDLEEGLAQRDEGVREQACRVLQIGPERLRGFRIVRRALDARRKRGSMSFVCSVEVVVDVSFRSGAMDRALRSGHIQDAPGPGSLRPAQTAESLRGGHVVVVGTGPAGIFAALPLALGGVEVTILERGTALEDRGRLVAGFHRRHELDPDTNLLFGEGGAGTYSDGKLYTRVNDELEVPILEELVSCGAPADIVFDARAHIGTDRLHRILPLLRKRLEDLGVEFRWETSFESIEFAPNDPTRVRGVATSEGSLACDGLVMAVGHSARDTSYRLASQGVPFEAKPFQLGVRIEHPQSLITLGRYGDGPEAEALGAASYNLQCRAGDGLPGAFSFCMCPGGRIVASVNEEGMLCTNGMSNSTHSSRWANAALVTTLHPETIQAELAALSDEEKAEALSELAFEPASELDVAFAGLRFQRALERRFFRAGGEDYTAPAQRADDFVAGRASSGEFATSYPFGARAGRVDQLLPELLSTSLRRALGFFGRSIDGFDGPDGLMVGLESRSSGPVRIPRAEDSRRVRGFANLYAVGEGSGYAGGIMSAALDGAHAAMELCSVGPR
ncbi:MAG: putative FAD-dependent dehydrogenase [Planctomycetota bacterium]|jgi:uncharacterized FAD-dependent dehydrogenase